MKIVLIIAFFALKRSAVVMTCQLLDVFFLKCMLSQSLHMHLFYKKVDIQGVNRLIYFWPASQKKE